MQKASSSSSMEMAHVQHGTLPEPSSIQLTQQRGNAGAVMNKPDDDERLLWWLLPATENVSVVPQGGRGGLKREEEAWAATEFSICLLPTLAAKRICAVKEEIEMEQKETRMKQGRKKSPPPPPPPRLIAATCDGNQTTRLIISKGASTGVLYLKNGGGQEILAGNPDDVKMSIHNNHPLKEVSSAVATAALRHSHFTAASCAPPSIEAEGIVIVVKSVQQENRSRPIEDEERHQQGGAVASMFVKSNDDRHCPATTTTSSSLFLKQEPCVSSNSQEETVSLSCGEEKKQLARNNNNNNNKLIKRTMKYSSSSSSSCLLTSTTVVLLWLLLLRHTLHVNSLVTEPSWSSQHQKAPPSPPPLTTLPVGVVNTEIQHPQHADSTSRKHNSTSIILAYTSYWDSLLLKEHAELEMDLLQRRKTWSRHDLVSSGLSILNAMAEPDSELFGEKIVRITVLVTSRRFGSSSSSGSNLRDTYTRGDVLVMTKGTDIIPRECLVVDVGNDWLTAGVGPTWPKGLYESRKLSPFSYRVRLDRTVPRAPLKAQRQALAQLSKFQAGVAANLLATTFLMGGGGGGAQEDATTRRAAAQELTSEAPPWLSTCSCTSTEERNTIISRAMKNALLSTNNTTTTTTELFQPNDSQAAAIQWALQRRMALIRGPPGTGKTQCAATLVATFLQLATSLQLRQQLPPQEENHEQSGTTDSKNDENVNNNNITTSTRSNINHRVLAVTHSNGAADVLLEALLKLNVPAVRLGRPAVVSPRVQHRTVVAISQRLPEVVKFRRLQQQQQQQITQQQDQQGRPTPLAELDVKRYMMDAQKMILETAPVVVTSCIGAHQLMLASNDSDDDNDGLKFSLVVLDEAAQATEPALVCALAAARAEQVIFVGDTQQLPPTVTSSCPQLRDSLGLSPMARLEKLDIGQVTLQTQYRMPAALLEHPSRYFYGGLVQCANNENDADCEEKPSAAPRPPAGFPWPNGQPLAFVQVTTGRANDCEIAHSFGGRSNPTEAALVVRIIRDLLVGGDIAGDDISVISPYSKQVQRIRTELSMMRNGAQDIRVGTVDSFQGQETGVVIFSAVRSNPFNELGFLRDRRRLCVAITRARRGLILVGDANVLKSCRHWAALLASCEERGLSMSDRDLVEQKRKQMVIQSEKNVSSTTKMSLEDALDDLLGGTDYMLGLFV
jgi:AAA domain